MTTKPLAPCPFCGSTNVDAAGWLGTSPPPEKTPTSGPACDGCGATADTIEKWNRRVPPPSQGITGEAVRKAIAVVRENGFAKPSYTSLDNREILKLGKDSAAARLLADTVERLSQPVEGEVEEAESILENRGILVESNKRIPSDDLYRMGDILHSDAAMTVLRAYRALRLELAALKQSQTPEHFKVMVRGYGFILSPEGEILALTAGDQNYEPTGIKLNDFHCWMEKPQPPEAL